MTASSLRTVSVAARTVLVALMVLATCTFLPSQQADAAVPCGTGGNYFKGYIHEPSAHADNFEGASGYITNRFADTCDSDTSSPSPLNQTIGTNFTTAWIMIADYTVTSWSQVGVISGYDLNAYFWAEVLRASPYEQYDRFVSLNAIGYDERHAYFEKWLSYCPPPTNGPCEESVIDSTRVTDTNFNPFTYFNGGPGRIPKWSPQYNGEKTYQPSQIPGTAAQPINFGSIGVQLYSNNQFVNEPCTLSISSPVAASAGMNATDCHNFSVWHTN